MRVATSNIPPSDPGGETIRAGDTPEPLPPDVREAAADLRTHFGPRDAAGRPKYYKVRLLGQGGMGAVFLGWDTGLGRYVAIKFLLGGATEEAVKRFRREAQACAGLRHPHIVSVHEADVWEGTPYLVMDYIEGTTLAAIYARKGHTRADAIRWTALIARALQTAHDKGFVHRDIKPQNIFIDGHGFPYLGDFGLAKSLAGGEELTAAGAVVGTPSYMAPEQARDDDTQIGARTDVYALGTVLYEGVTGQRPFTGRDALTVMHKVIHETPSTPIQIDRTIPPGLNDVIVRAMARDPRERFGSARELAEALDRVAEGAPAAKKKSAAEPIVAAAVLLVVAAIAIGVLFSPGSTVEQLEPPPDPVVVSSEDEPSGDVVGPDVSGLPSGTFRRSGTDTWNVQIPGIDFKRVKMRQHWAALWKIAKAWREDAVLVRIGGRYIREDGSADASDPEDYETGWMYIFYSARTPVKKFDEDRERRLGLYIREGKVFVNWPAGNSSDTAALPPEFLDSDAIWKLLKSRGAKDSGHLSLTMDLEADESPLHRGNFDGASDAGDFSAVFDFKTGKISE